MWVVWAFALLVCYVCQGEKVFAKRIPIFFCILFYCECLRFNQTLIKWLCDSAVLEIACRCVSWMDWYSWMLILLVCVSIFPSSFSVRMLCNTVQRLAQFWPDLRFRVFFIIIITYWRDTFNFLHLQNSLKQLPAACRIHLKVSAWMKYTWDTLYLFVTILYEYLLWYK